MLFRSNIIFFSRLFYPHIGGVEKHVLEISKILVKKGYKVTVITENYDSLPEKEQFQNINIIRINTGNINYPSKFKIWFELLKHFKTILSADVVHCHDIFFWYLPFRFIFPSKRVYTTFHGYEGNNSPGKKEIFMHKAAEKLSFGNICVGDYLEKWYGTKASIVTYGAVSIPKNLPKENKVNKIKNIVYIGRLEKEAGILTYIKALSILKKRGFDFKLTVLGDGKQRNKAEKYVKENNLNVEFKGFVKEVYDYLPFTDVIFTSRYLGTLESFVFKKVVFVVYNNPIKKDCFIMSPFRDYIILKETEEELADRFLEYIKNPSLMTMQTVNAFKWVSRQTWEKLTYRYIDLWQI